jgi:hypothetical protein
MSIELRTSLKTPISGRSFFVSPFSMKEYKWMALSDKQAKVEDCIEMMRQVISSYSTLDPDTLSIDEFQWVFVQICRISCGSIIEFSVGCRECKTDIPFKISLDDFELTKNNVSNIINVDEETSIVLKHISLSDLVKAKNDITDIRYVIDCIKTGDVEFDISNVSSNELVEFIESLVSSDVEYIMDWLYSNNKYQLTKQWICPHCYAKNIISLSGIADVFKITTFHINVTSFYKTSFRLAKDFGLSISDIEQMKPFEYKIYINEVLGYIKEEESRIKNK